MLLRWSKRTVRRKSRHKRHNTHRRPRAYLPFSEAKCSKCACRLHASDAIETIKNTPKTYRGICFAITAPVAVNRNALGGLSTPCVSIVFSSRHSTTFQQRKRQKRAHHLSHLQDLDEMTLFQHPQVHRERIGLLSKFQQSEANHDHNYPEQQRSEAPHTGSVS